MPAVIVNVGHKVSMSIVYLDANGNPMLTTPTPDSPPVWTDSTPATGGLVVSADGLTAVETAIAPGSDTVNLTVVVGGVSFAASQAITVDTAAQGLTSIEIDATVF